ncbi:Pre-mRNA-splicing factor SPF27 [Nemania sp. FL0031]|nr:Pre-mRNA-splicing factor SPF27 [Nemania sp. FL0031]
MTSSIRTTVHESLPYIDQDPTPTERTAAEAQITAELSSSSSSPSPSSLPPAYTPNFSPLITTELTRVSQKQPLNGIDLSRYEAQDASTLSSPSSTQSPSDLTPLLTRAYATHTYLQGRQANLQLLEAYGKNAWLVGNWQSEAALAALERDLAAAKREVDVVNIQRRRLQDEVGEELRGLEDAWKRSVGRVLETEVATEALRQQVLKRQREGV